MVERNRDQIKAEKASWSPTSQEQNMTLPFALMWVNNMGKGLLNLTEEFCNNLEVALKDFDTYVTQYTDGTRTTCPKISTELNKFKEQYPKTPVALYLGKLQRTIEITEEKKKNSTDIDRITG